MDSSYRTQILSKTEIDQKINRIAYQIFEDFCDEAAVIVVGIDGNGYQIAERITRILGVIAPFSVELVKVSLDKHTPLQDRVEVSAAVDKFENMPIVVVDDVLNSGKTMMYALRPILDRPVKKLRTAVLVDRNHKKYPVAADYVGISLATTLQEHITVDLQGEEAAFLS